MTKMQKMKSDPIARRWLLGGALGIGLFAFCLQAAVAQERLCAVPPDTFEDEPVLTKTAKALKQGKKVLVVAMGGASTLGNAAGGIENSWPGRFAAALTARFPDAQIAVVNRGAPRMTASDMTARLERDILDMRPSLVILETGTTDAVRNVDPGSFRDAVQSAIEQVREDGPEIVLMDMQYSRRTHAVINFDRYLAAMREVANIFNVPLFPRHELMRLWTEEGGELELPTRDREKRRQQAAWLYTCIGNAMADFVARNHDSAVQ